MSFRDLGMYLVVQQVHLALASSYVCSRVQGCQRIVMWQLEHLLASLQRAGSVVDGVSPEGLVNWEHLYSRSRHLCKICEGWRP